MDSVDDQGRREDISVMVDVRAVEKTGVRGIFGE